MYFVLLLEMTFMNDASSVLSTSPSSDRHSIWPSRFLSILICLNSIWAMSFTCKRWKQNLQDCSRQFVVDLLARLNKSQARFGLETGNLGILDSGQILSALISRKMIMTRTIQAIDFLPSCILHYVNVVIGRGYGNLSATPIL